MTNTVFAALSLTAVLTMSRAGPAEAQIRPQAGVSLDVFAAGSPARPELQANVSTPLTDKWSAEALFSVSRRTTAYERSVEGEYGAAFRRVATPDAATSAFFSVGMLGGYFHRSDTAGSNTFVFPPLLATIGGGSRSRISPLLTVEADIELVLALYYPVALRTTVGIAVPIGRSRP